MTVTALPAAINHHWTKALTASADGRFLYVGHRLQQQHHRARHGRRSRSRDGLAGRRRRPALIGRYATGLRNPTALAIQPGTDRLWARSTSATRSARTSSPTTSLRFARAASTAGPTATGETTSTCARSRRIRRKVAAAIAPDYALGSHVAALGLAFSGASMGVGLRRGRIRRRARQLEPKRARRLQGRVRAVPRRPTDRRTRSISSPGFLGDGRQDARPAGRRHRGSARRIDRRRRSVQYRLEGDAVRRECGQPVTHLADDGFRGWTLRVRGAFLGNPLPPETSHVPAREPA